LRQIILEYHINIIDNNMSKTLFYNDKIKENKQFKISEMLSEEEQQEEEEKEFIILKIYKSEIDKAIKDLKQLNKLNQYYEPDYKLIVERYKDTILDDYGWYESLKQAIRTTDKTLHVYDEL
jgi:broad-specificity NMP kinase